MIETGNGKYYTTKEILDKVQISETTLKKWLIKGKIHRVRLGNKRYFHESEIDNLFAVAAVAAATEVNK